MKVKLIMTFWTDGQEHSSRLRNLTYTWVKLKYLSQFLNNNGVLSEPILYDFSPQSTNNESIHIPYELGEYKRSEKLNLITTQTSTEDILFFFDCDTFFQENDYPNVLNLLNTIRTQNIYTFDLAKLSEGTTTNLINNQINNLYEQDWWFAYSGEKNKGPLNGYLGGLGGVFIIKSGTLKELGGFNEQIKTWGGEDGELTDRYIKSRIGEIIPQRNFFPFHLNHFSDWGNKLYYDK